MHKGSVLVTGGTGFVGRYVTAELLAEGATVYVLTRKDDAVSVLDGGIRVVRGDITQDFSMPADVTTVYHCAGVISGEDLMEKVNVHGTRRIVDAALEGHCRLIHLSSAGVVGRLEKKTIEEDMECRPQSLYETTKYQAELIVKKGIASGLKAQILRPTIVFGLGREPSKDSFLHLIRSIRSGRYRHIGDGSGIYNIIHAKEVARAMCALASEDIPNGGVYFINTPVSFREFSETVLKTLGGKYDTIPGMPHWAAFSIAAVFSFFSALTGRQMPLTLSRFHALTNNNMFSQRRLIEMTQCKPLLDVNAYIKQVCEEYRGKGLLS